MKIVWFTIKNIQENSRIYVSYHLGKQFVLVLSITDVCKKKNLSGMNNYMFLSEGKSIQFCFLKE